MNAATETTPLEEYVTNNGVAVEITRDRGVQRAEDGWEHHAYVLSVRWADGRTVSDIAWRQGLGIEDSPTDRAADVLYAVVSDASVEAAGTFEQWADDYGYDTDSRAAERIYLACRMLRAKLNTAGIDVDTLRNLEH